MSRFSNLGDRLYTGEVSYDFVGQRKKWYVISAVLLIVTLAAIIFRGLNLGIEFQGGAKYNIPSTTKSVAEIRDVFTQLGQPSSIVKEVGGERVEVQIPPIEVEAGEALKQDVAEAVEVAADLITVQNVGPSWGADITRTALIGLGVFIILVSIFLAIYFEFRMAIAALITVTAMPPHKSIFFILSWLPFLAPTPAAPTPASAAGMARHAPQNSSLVSSRSFIFI